MHICNTLLSQAISCDWEFHKLQFVEGEISVSVGSRAEQSPLIWVRSHDGIYMDSCCR